MDFCGLLTFSKDLLCRKEVLGEKFDTVIYGINVKVCFPCYPEDTDDKLKELNTPLNPPSVDRPITRDKKAIAWGSPMSYPMGNSIVKAVMFLIDCEEDMVENNAKVLYDAIKVWGRKFTDYCDLCTKKATMDFFCVDTNTCTLELIYKKSIPSSHNIRFEVNFLEGSMCLSKDNICNAIKFASLNDEILFEYQMLSSAYQFRNDRQYRQAVVDACSAVEICLNKQIEKYCDKIGLKKSILTEKYRYLSDKFKLVSKIDSSFPKCDYKNDIVEVRNAVVHSKKTDLSITETNVLISTVEKVLAHFNKDYY